MKALYAALSAAALTLSLSSMAGAVDLQELSYGDDMDNVNLSITENGQTRRLVLMSGETIYNVCGACTITLEDGKSVQASGHDMVETNGSSIKVYKASELSAQQALLPAAENADADALATPENSIEGGGTEGGESDGTSSES